MEPKTIFKVDWKTILKWVMIVFFASFLFHLAEDAADKTVKLFKPHNKVTKLGYFK